MTATTGDFPDTGGPIEVMAEDPRWAALDLSTLANRAASAALTDHGLDPAAVEIALLACDDARILELNRAFRGKPQPTNVLSWPADDLGAEIDGERPAPVRVGQQGQPESLGDIALSIDTCTAEAQAQGKPIEAHVMHLVVHAVLHLLGYDHERDRDAALMENTEARILALLGLPDPYGPEDTQPD